MFNLGNVSTSYQLPSRKLVSSGLQDRFLELGRWKLPLPRVRTFQKVHNCAHSPKLNEGVSGNLKKNTITSTQVIRKQQYECSCLRNVKLFLVLNCKKTPRQWSFKYLVSLDVFADDNFSFLHYLKLLPEVESSPGLLNDRGDVVQLLRSHSFKREQLKKSPLLHHATLMINKRLLFACNCCDI